jgi:hypothetical protein
MWKFKEKIFSIVSNEGPATRNPSMVVAQNAELNSAYTLCLVVNFQQKCCFMLLSELIGFFVYQI